MLSRFGDPSLHVPLGVAYGLRLPPQEAMGGGGESGHLGRDGGHDRGGMKGWKRQIGMGGPDRPGPDAVGTEC